MSKSFTVTSHNRGAAKKLLTFCGVDSVQVRTMTLAQLNENLRLCINKGLITTTQVIRALTSDRKAQKDNATQGTHKNSNNKDHDNDYDKQDDGGQGNQGDGNAKGEQSKGGDNADGEDKGNEQSGDGDSEAEDGDGEQESESEQEQEQEQATDDDEIDDGKPLEHHVLRRVLKYISAGLNVALVGPAGTGKSYIARQVAELTERDFHVNGAMMSKYDLIGYNDAHGTYHPTPAYSAFKDGGLHCFDELDASAPDAVVAFNGMTDDQPFYTFPCGQVEQHEKYVAIACMNTWGNGASADYVGRYKQDAASMSRFVKVYVDYDEKIEKRIAGKHKDILNRVWLLRKVCNDLGIRHIVSTRMVVQAKAARDQGRATKTEIDTDILFAGLDDNAVSQIKNRMTKEAGKS